MRLPKWGDRIVRRGLAFFACSLFLGGFLVQKDRFVQKRYEDADDYMKARKRLIQAELAMRIDGGIKLAPEEEKANERLMLLKQAEIERTREYFPPAHSFLQSKTRQLIDQSPILEIMKRMPKGGILHVHGFAMGDFQWLVKHATYLPNCYIYQGKEELPRQGTMRISTESPGDGWRLVGDLRKAADSVEGFDEELYKSVTLGEEDLGQPDIWLEFRKCFARFLGLFNDEIWSDFCRKMLRDMIAENVQYVETRAEIGDQNIIEEIRHDNPEFQAKYIFASRRPFTRERIAKDLSQALDERAAHPGLITGFDLTDEEDKEHTNLFFIHELLAARHKAEQRNITLPFYLHSGESNWTENENVLDAILLDARRIGHGIALFKHPLLMQIVKDRGMAIEVCPIANQVLGYVADLRNHPAVLYINSGLPVVICPDGPGIWKGTFSYDFYMAFMAWGLDLKCLKQLAMNSLIYSAMDPEEKEKALEFWREKWEEFITWLNGYEV
jgi:adenosine deaminase-related growth factor